MEEQNDELDNFEEAAEPDEPTAEEPEHVYTEGEFDEYARAVEGYLSKCANGQPYDEGEPVWINEHTTLNDVMELADVPEDCREEVAKRVSCPVGDGPHSLWEEVGIKSDGELRYEALMDEWYVSRADQLDDFYEFLQKHPYLGAAHRLGKEIRDSISGFPATNIEDELFYRARRITSGRDYRRDDFLPPDANKVSIGEGRYNHHGQSVIYLADDKEGAAIECVAEGESRAWVQAFRIREMDKILNLSDEEEWADEDMPLLAFGLMHSGAVRKVVDRTDGWKPEYFIPRYVADCAREAGFNGILFKSVRHWRTNLVLFNYDAGKISPEGEPEIIKVEEWKRSDWMYRDREGVVDIPLHLPGITTPDKADDSH
jgi:RES domain